MIYFTFPFHTKSPILGVYNILGVSGMGNISSYLKLWRIFKVLICYARLVAAELGIIGVEFSQFDSPPKIFN